MSFIFENRFSEISVGVNQTKLKESMEVCILETMEFLCRLWAEIEAHKWRDLKLNLSKTATKAIEF